MKKMFLTAVILAAAQLTPLVHAEQPNARGANAGAVGRRHQNGRRFATLPEQDRQKLRLAHQKALHDPSVQAARTKMRQVRREFRDAMRGAMLKADPSIQPILDRLPRHAEQVRDEG